MKLYFKKLFTGILYFLLGVLIYFVASSVIRLIANSLGPFGGIALIGIPSLIVGIIVHRRRVNDPTYRQEFLSAYRQSSDDPFRLILKLRGFVTEVAACATIVGVGMIIAALSVGVNSLGIRLVVGVFGTLVITAIYAAFDALSWHLVLRDWRESAAQ